MFFDEFASLCVEDENKITQKNINKFKIIDDLYSTKKEIKNINFNQFFKEFKSEEIISKFKKESKNQLITLDNNIINNFVYYKDNLFKSL